MQDFWSFSFVRVQLLALSAAKNQVHFFYDINFWRRWFCGGQGWWLFGAPLCLAFAYFRAFATGATALTRSLPTCPQKLNFKTQFVVWRSHTVGCSHQRTRRSLESFEANGRLSVMQIDDNQHRVCVCLFVCYSQNHVRLLLCCKSWSLVILATDKTPRDTEILCGALMVTERAELKKKKIPEQFCWRMDR